MNRFKRLFQDAERLAPPPDLWRRIEAQVRMRSGEKAGRMGFGAGPAWRAAASVVLAAGLLILGLGFLRDRSGPGAPGGRDTALAAAGTEPAAEIFDADLLGWQADLGEVDMEAEEAGEML